MQNLPHVYTVTATAQPVKNIDLTSPGLATIECAPPAEFGGPGDLWSPETLLAAAVADCFVLTFKAIARASKLEWNSLSSEVDGVLDRTDDVLRFTEFKLRVTLDAPSGTDERRAIRLLEKAENSCLITNSLKSSTHLSAEVRIAA